jgi:hypothetical protein
MAAGLRHRPVSGTLAVGYPIEEHYGDRGEELLTRARCPMMAGFSRRGMTGVARRREKAMARTVGCWGWTSGRRGAVEVVEAHSGVT